MSGSEQTLVIVYQFGKVASTSLVNTLKRNPGLEVHQSHFLGESALQRIIPHAVRHSTNAYFHQHLAGQLAANVALTYRMNRVLGGEGQENLKVISLSRAPLDWFRSSILQDIEGYKPDLLALAARRFGATHQANNGLQSAIELVLSDLTNMIEANGGLNRLIPAFLERGGQDLIGADAPKPEQIVRKLFFVALRPVVWFEEHFRPAFGFGLEDFSRQGDIWIARRPRADFALLRYEDLEAQFSVITKALGLNATGPLQRDNVSKCKPGADAVQAAFASPAAQALAKHLNHTDYADFFGYSYTEMVSQVASPLEKLL